MHIKHGHQKLESYSSVPSFDMLLCCSGCWGICRHCQLLPPLCSSLCIGLIAPLNHHKDLSTLASHQKDPVHKRQDLSNSASGLSNCRTNKTIQRQYSLLCKDTWHLLLSFSSREVKNKTAVPQVFQGLGCFCCRSILWKLQSFTLNASKCWTSLGDHPQFSKLLHYQAGWETFCE